MTTTADPRRLERLLEDGEALACALTRLIRTRPAALAAALVERDYDLIANVVAEVERDGRTD